MVPETKKMNTFPWESRAASGEEMPDGLEYPDQIMYLQLRLLYAQLKQGIVTRDKAIAEKRKLFIEYQAYKIQCEIGEQWVDFMRASEVLRAEFRKAPRIETAQKLVALNEATITAKQILEN